MIPLMRAVIIPALCFYPSPRRRLSKFRSMSCPKALARTMSHPHHTGREPGAIPPRVVGRISPPR
jgi:hypothetical protein